MIMKTKTLVEVLKRTLVNEDLVIGFDSEIEKMDFILDICNAFKKELKKIRNEPNVIEEVKQPANYFTQHQIETLQSKVYKITGKGEIMGFFNELLGVKS